ncbi:hypothetical protein K491DRAFT_719772 [Lophiostoma macrostomum CBS 122681]|uniref:DUF1772-domain-containing protein n=1 Tax=Lophiostoma macrostomum CBS 122681 TaxID=1314788 RepID=A0A6A6SV90_9PLEO|nr:hypothetical protein K491DRAFT_719772 [Lophiostoma macrostomum CBS 122681]
MSLSTSMDARSKTVYLAQVIGITSPIIYSSLTFAYSWLVVPPIVDHAPPKLLAKQWLQAYQAATGFVVPFVLSGTLANAALGYLSKSRNTKILYGVAAVLTWSIMPVTILYFEPNINGSAKWKVQKLLEDEGYTMKENERLLPYVDRQTGKPEARRWAATVDLKEIVTTWARYNAWRGIAPAAAALLSIGATSGLLDFI